MEIRLLNEATINKIAAGEVVENPAAVVKELVENAIDAHASSVTVEIESGGIKKIRVTDNGSGISAAELPLAIARHATSKIFDYKDLINIATLGFRGEALSSISAVSMMEIATKTRQQEMGAIASIEGGTLMNTKAAGLPNGTTVVVKNLFFNTPARYKFLKSAGQEAASVAETVLRLILSHPEVSFRYINNGEAVYHSSGSGQIKDALICTFGKDMLSKLVPVDYTRDGIHVFGYTGLPQFSMKNRRRQYFIVNGRTVQGQNLSYYIQNAYSQRLLKGQYPFVLLYMDMAYNATDVNVHPGKLIIRFKDEGKIEYILGEAVNEALAKKPVAGVLHIREDKPAMQNAGQEMPEANGPEKPPAEPETEQPVTAAPKPETGFTAAAAGQTAPEAKNNAGPQEDLRQMGFFKGSAGRAAVHADDGKFYDVLKGIEEKEALLYTEKDEEEKEELLTEKYRVIGQAFNSFILIECGDKLLLLDQHAAHERLLFDKMVEAYENGEDLSTGLLLPEVIRVAPAEKQLIAENMEAFTRIGFDIEEFGPLEYRISAVPYLFKGTNVESMLDEIIGELKTGAREKPLIRAQGIMKAACKKAVKANMRLNDDEIGIIIDSFLKNATLPTCPHGRPVLTVITKAEIEKGFKRRV